MRGGGVSLRDMKRLSTESVDRRNLRDRLWSPPDFSRMVNFPKSPSFWSAAMVDT